MSSQNLNINSEIESFQDITFKGSTVLSIIAFLVTTFGAVVWFLFTQGAFTPDAELSQEFAMSQYRYENLVKEHENALSTISELEQRNLSLSDEVSKLRSGVESESVQSEERIRLKQLELENERLLRIAEVEAKARIAEAEATKTVSEQESLARRAESENELRARTISACVEAKGIAVSGSGMLVAQNYLDDCTAQYERQLRTSEE